LKRTIPSSFARAMVLALFLPGLATAADIQISQLVDTPDPGIRGGEITYSTSVLNGTNDTANNVVLTLPLPASTTIVASKLDPSCSHDGGTPGTVTCNLGNITGDGLGNPVITINTTIKTTAATGNTIAVTANVSSDSPDSNSTNNSATQNTTIDDGADLTATLTDAADPVIAGGHVSYTVTIDNLGPNNASAITVTNTLPSDVTFVSASGSGWSCSNAGQTVTCTRASLNSGVTAPALTITAQVTGAITGTITDSVTVSSTTGDPDPNNNTATEDTVISTGTDLAISQSISPNPVIGNQTATFTLSPRNNGPFDASNAVVTNTLPAGFNFTGVSVTGSGSWSCSESGGTVTCNLANFTVGNSDNIVISTTAPASGSFTNTANISSGTADPISTNDSSSASATIVPDGADLAITKSKTPYPVVAQGSPINSSINVTNNGPQATSGTITVTETLNGETYVSASGTNWSCSASGTAPNETVTCAYSGAPVASGASTPALQITTTATNAGTLTNTASVSDVGGTTDGILANNTVSASTTSTAQIADLSITKTADAGGDSTLTVTENTITYSLTITNNGPDSLVDVADGTIDEAVVVRDTIPKYVSGVVGATPNTTGITVTSSNPDFVCTTGSTLICQLKDGATFANGRSETFTIEVTRPIHSGVSLNTANVYSSVLGDNNSSNNTSNQTSITVDPIADIELTAKTITPNPVQAGTEATYVISLRNNGPSSAENVTLQDVFSPPAGRNYTVLSVTPSSGGSCQPFGANAANTLDCTFGTVPRNGTRSVTIVIRPEWDSGNNTWSMNNTATVTTTTDQGANASPDSKTATLNVGQADVDLLVNDTDMADPVGYSPAPPSGSLDNIIVYKIEMTNRGPSLATGVVLSDVMTPKAGKQLTFLCDDAGASSCTVGTSTCDNTSVSVTGPASLTLTCPQADMNANTTRTRYLFFKVDSAPDAAGDTHNNVASINSNEDDSIPSNDSESEATSVRSKVDVGVIKTPSLSTVDINQPFDWNLVVFNNGPGISEQTVLSDTLPAGMVLTGTPTTSIGSCTGSIGGTSFNCTIGTLNKRATAGVADGNDVAITVPVKVTSWPSGGSLTNTASVTTFGVDSDSSNDSDSGTVSVQKSSIAGFVYADNNDDGNMTSGETGISGVTLTLTGTDRYGNPVNQTATTDASGAYLFDNLPPSDSNGYSITETHPSAFVDGKENAAGTIIPNSNTTDVISNIALASNTALTGYLFGELGVSSTTALLSGYVYNDGSDDGIRDPENPGIPNVTITLTGTLDAGGTVNLTTTTDANGAWSFPNLQPGTYTVTETQPSGYDDHIDTAGTINGVVTGTAGNDVISNIVLPAGSIGLEYNFADSNTAITGFVYVDANDDGIKDSGESGIPGVTLTLTGNDTNGNPVNLSTTTDSNGAYSFTGILASDSNGYTVTETQPTAWADGKDTVGNAGGTAGNDAIHGILIGSSTRANDYNFGELGAALAGIVYNDNGDDGQKQASDPGIPGVTLILTGTDLNGNPVSRTMTTDDAGHYRFDNLPLPDGNGYTLTETQPAGINSGKENTSNVITGITIPSPGIEVDGFNFGEIIPPAQTASVSGKVHDRDNPNHTYAGWIVEILRNGVVVASTVTDAGSGYRFDGLQPGTGYTIHFRHPESRAVFGVIENVSLTANTELPDQNFPLDPSGVIYDSVTRQPVPGAVVTLSGPPGFNPATDLIGGTGNVSQTVGSDGMYKFLLNPTAPSGTYRLTVIQPAGYLPPVSTNIPAPCNGPLAVGATPDPALIQPQITAPPDSSNFHDPAACPALGTAGTQYYLSFDLSPASADVVNNHIPLDPEGHVTGLTVTKSTPKVNVVRGDLVPYTIRITNHLATPITNIRIRDQIPPGFKYVSGSATLDGQKTEPQINSRELTWPAQDYAVGQTHEVKLVLVIGSGVSEGEYINRAWGVNGTTGVTATQVAEATVRIVPDPTFDCTDLIGKVFDDRNTNGYQDQGERGLPGVRLATARGLLVTTDAEGRYHVPCAAVPNEMHGSNFIMKLDERTLPSGYRVTTENPRVVRLTRGKLAKLNFGAAIHRVVRLDLDNRAFQTDGADLRPNYEQHVRKLQKILAKEPSVLRLAYAADGEDKKLIKQRLKSFRKHLQALWSECDCNYELIIENEVLWSRSTTRDSAVTGRAK